MRELHTLAWYRKRLAPYLPKEIYKPAASRLIGGFVYGIVIAAGLLLISMFDLNIWVKLLLTFILGTSFAAVGFLGHEILHGVVVRGNLIRNLLGALCFFPLNVGPRLWIKWHNLSHHVHTQDEKKDPDAWPTIEQISHSPFIFGIYKRLPLCFRALVSFISLAFTFTGHSIHMFSRYIKEMDSKEKLTVVAQLIITWSTWFGLLILIGLEKWFFAYLLPLFIGNFIVMAYISTNHRLNPLVTVNDPLANSLTVTVPKWVDVLHFNFSHHTEHHLFPGINPKYYPLIKEHIKRLWPDLYNEMPLSKALLALWKTPRVYYEKEQFLDPHLGNLYGTLGNGLDPDKIV
jgi:fatty acid desaturase